MFNIFKHQTFCFVYLCVCCVSLIFCVYMAELQWTWAGKCASGMISSQSSAALCKYALIMPHEGFQYFVFLLILLMYPRLIYSFNKNRKLMDRLSALSNNTDIVLQIRHAFYLQHMTDVYNRGGDIYSSGR